MEQFEARNSHGSVKRRLAAWLLNVLGNLLVLHPVISEFTWIPFIGHLMVGLPKLATVVLALIFGSVLTLLVLSLSWVWYRPLQALLLLSVVGVSAALILYQEAQFEQINGL